MNANIAHDSAGVLVQNHVQRCRDILGDVLLNRENVIKRPVIALRPHVESIRRADQLRRDADPLAVAAHRTLDDMPHIKMGANIGRRDTFSLEKEGGCPRDHAQLWQLCQGVQDFFGQSVGEIAIVLA